MSTADSTPPDHGNRTREQRGQNGQPDTVHQLPGTSNGVYGNDVASRVRVPPSPTEPPEATRTVALREPPEADQRQRPRRARRPGQTGEGERRVVPRVATDPGLVDFSQSVDTAELTGVELAEPDDARTAERSTSTPASASHTRQDLRRTQATVDSSGVEPDAEADASSAHKSTRGRRRRTIIAAAALLATITAAVLLVGGVLTNSGRAPHHAAMSAMSHQTADLGQLGGADPRSSLHPTYSPPTDGRTKRRSDHRHRHHKAAVAHRRRHHTTATVNVASNSTQPAESSSYQPTETTSEPTYSTTAPVETTPAPVQTTPSQPSGGGDTSGGSSSTDGNSSSSGTKSPAFGAGGALAPGSSPDG